MKRTGRIVKWSLFAALFIDDVDLIFDVCEAVDLDLNYAAFVGLRVVNALSPEDVTSSF